MAESAAELILDIKEEFATCEVCTDYFNDSDKSPRILPCHHSFCSQCLQSIWRNDPAGLTCPSCRRVWPVAKTISESFPSNKIIQNVMEYIKLKTKPEHIMCQVCSDGSCATVRCTVCDQWLCSTCESYHKKFQSSKEHKTILIEEYLKMPEGNFFQRKQMCKQHESVKLDLFCISCSEAICSSCAHVSHRDHDIQNLTDVYNEKKLLITTALNSLQETSDACTSHMDKLLTEKRTLDEMKQSHLQDIDDTSNAIIKKVKDKARHLKKEVIASVASQQADISKQVQIIAQSESIKQQHVLYCQQALSYARVLDFIEMSQDLDDKNKTLKKGPEFKDVPIKKDKPLLKILEEIERMRTCIEVADTKTGLETEVIKVNLLPRVCFKRFLCFMCISVCLVGIYSLNVDLTRKIFFGVVGQFGSNRDILLPSVQFNKDSVNRECCSITEDDSLVNKPSPAPKCDPPGRLKRLHGVISKSSISSVGATYWETEVECEMLESEADNWVAVQGGLCCENHCDDEIQIDLNKHAWGFVVFICREYNSMCVGVYSRGQYVSVIPIIPFKYRTQLNLTIGLLLDSHTHHLHVIHVNDNKLLSSISDVDVSQSLMPVFGVYGLPHFNVKLRVVSIRDLTLNHELQTLLSCLIHP